MPRSAAEEAAQQAGSSGAQGVADRVRTGRSPHLNPAYQTTRQRPHRHRARGTTFAGEAEWDAQNADDAASSSRADNLPMVHPGADLPPLPHGRLAEKRVGKFSFVSDPSERTPKGFYGHEVPNNTPKPKLPMWASSLTSPALGKVRLVAESWISQDARGRIDAATTAQFVQWLRESAAPAASLLGAQLQTNVQLDLRRSTARGVYAKRAFCKGDVILAIPVSTADGGASSTAGTPWLTLNSETLERNSEAAAPHQRPGLPSYETVKAVLSARRSELDPIPHPLFIDQVHAALLLACEKADGAASPLFPYIRLLDPAELFDDEAIKERHLGVLEPMTHMEYGEHVSRFRHYVRELHAAWWAAYSAQVQGAVAEQPEATAAGGGVSAGHRAGATVGPAMLTAAPPLPIHKTAAAADTTASEVDAPAPTPPADSLPDTTPASTAPTATSAKPPPSLEDMEWAFRVVLSRQRILPHLRVDRAPYEKIEQETVEGEELDALGKAIMKGKYAFYKHVLRAVDEDRLHVNEVDPSGIATVVPLLDMLSNPPGGVPNVAYALERMDAAPIAAAGSGSDAAALSQDRVKQERRLHTGSASAYHVVVRAIDDIDEDEELTVAYTKCYSVAYTLYRYGFLPLARREDEVAALLHANGVGDSRLTASGSGVLSALRRWWSSS